MQARNRRDVDDVTPYLVLLGGFFHYYLDATLRLGVSLSSVFAKGFA
jgi:hypothetical protein